MSVPAAIDLHPAGIAARCGRERFGHTAVLLETAGSTNAAAVVAAAAGAPEGTVIMAVRQTAGRGRSGRSWFSSETGSLVFSLILRPRRPAGSLTVLMALAAAGTLETFAGGVAIKWPNDILIGGRKIAGILAEACAGAVVLGMGIDVNEDEDSFPPQLRAQAVSLRMLAGASFERAALLVDLLLRFGALYEDWERCGFDPLRLEVERRLLWRGEKVRIESGTAAVEGILLGLSEDGRLRLGRPDGELVIAAGDVLSAQETGLRSAAEKRKDSG